MMVNIHRPAWAEIDLTAIAHNMRQLRRLTHPSAKVMAVVKANAYGHGAVPVSKTVLANGADYLGVAILDEARELRTSGVAAPILVLGFTPIEQAEEIIQLDLAQTIYTIEAAEALSRAAARLNRKAKIHVKIDTGMGRLGFLTDIHAPEELARIAALPGLEIDGILTHFSVADIKDKEYTYQQYEKFLTVLAKTDNPQLQKAVKHAANSAAVIDLPEMNLDMVRVGVSLYGLYPSAEVAIERIDLRPAMTFKAKVAHVKKVPAGVSISYGRSFVTRQETVVATIPVGYADGYSRLLSNKAHVLIRGHKVPVIGNICMDQFMVDVSAVPDTQTGDEVILIGQQGVEKVTADELAGLMGTINYEIVCMISDRVPRIHIGS